MTDDEARALVPGAFLLASCQRWVWVCTTEMTEELVLPQSRAFELHRGKAAYNFLLRVATGLESQVIGETDIFGQLKEAWAKCDTCPRDARSELSPWMQRLFEDTKEIRSQHLQNLGGSSYGTLVRRIVREHSQGEPGPVLIIGAGQIARAVAPFLQDHELWLWNRSAENLKLLQDELDRSEQSHKKNAVRLLATEQEKEEAWKKAAHVIICVPIDGQREAARSALWRQNAQRGSVVHLGGYRNQCGEWTAIPEFHALDEVFELQRSQGEVRSVQIARAARACEERAKLRALGASITIPHGWEDLAAFA